jgi:transposase
MIMKKDKKLDRRSFTPTFKENAVGLAQELGNAAAASRQLGVSQSLLRSWIILSQLRAGSGVGLAASLQEKDRMAKLERQVKALEEENAILKKATAYFAQGHLNRGTPSSKSTDRNGR